MTGYGLGSAPLLQGTLSLEIRALNHKNQDIRVRAPGDLGDYGAQVEALVRKELGRGRFDIALRYDGNEQGEMVLSVPKATSAWKSIVQLHQQLCPETPLSFSDILTMPGLFESKQLDAAETQKSIAIAFEKAKAQLSEMRSTEGQALLLDMNDRLARLEVLTQEMKERISQIAPEQRQRLRERVDALLEGTSAQLSEERLELELALLAEKADVTEELVRLSSHFQQLKSLYRSKEPVGRRIDFRLQEVGREVNTIGSKSHDTGLAHHVVEMKAELERLREQVQNVE
ncbi:MAG: YicC family protein [Polyangiaceae bacterium]|nr:YicC family protein [Polyangiaceae bacterium]